MQDLRYPIGEFTLVGELTADERGLAVQEIGRAPARLRAAVAGLSDEQLDTPYRPDGWTIRQVVHHLVDSHTNAFARLKLMLTEETPTIRAYDEARWAELADHEMPVESSLALLERLHERWALIWKSLDASDWARKMNHPEEGEMTADDLLALYAWHGEHHIAHITSLKERMGW